MVEFFGGSLDDSLVALREARTLGEQAGLVERLADIDVTIGTALRHKGEIDAAIAALSVVAEADPSAPVPRKDRQFRAVRPRPGAAVPPRRRAGARGRRAPGPHRRAGRPAVRAGDERRHPGAGGDHQRGLRGGRAARRRGDRALPPVAVHHERRLRDERPGRRAARAERVADAIAQLEEGLAMATEYRDDRLEGFCSTNLTWALLHSGDADGALLAAERGADRLASNGVTIAPARARSPTLSHPRAATRAPRSSTPQSSRRAIPTSTSRAPVFLDAAAGTLAR
jgi:hypothetical protein